MNRLRDKVALVTGAGRGIGAATARIFLQEGARVVLSDIDEAGESAIAGLGNDASYVRHDVGSEQDWKHAVSHSERCFGRLDILVNNAGIFANSTVESTTVELFERLVRVNQAGVFLGMRAVADALRKSGGGSIINISSGAGLRANPNSFAYASTKWAVRGMTKNAAVDLAADNIRVNSIHPGLIETPMVDGLDAKTRDYITALIPVRRLGTAEEVATVALFLASDDASYMTGAELTVDGGSTL